MSKGFAKKLFDRGLLSKEPVGEHWLPIRTKDKKFANYFEAKDGGMWHLGDGWLYNEETDEFSQVETEQERRQRLDS
jgi:hypothetical protein